MPKGEFENRERDEVAGLGNIPLSGGLLGELPETLSEERGDLDGYSLRAAENNSPDMARAAQGRADERNTGLGSPAMDYTVRSVYDSRPPSGKDFNLWFYTDTPICGTEDFSGFALCWQVPDGYVAVIRKVKILLDPTASVGFPYHGLLRVLINGASNDPEIMRVGTGNENSVPVQLTGIPFRDGDDGVETFVIADQNQYVGVDFPSYSPGITVQPYVGFYGNFLLKTGRPAMFEPSNLAGRARSAVTSSSADLGNIASGSDVVARKRRKVFFPNVPILRK
jgi:hypothetical protein